jgi:hypothetical protein
MFQPFSQENSFKLVHKLDVESEVGVGTRFRIWLDFDQANEEIRKDIKNDDLGNFNSLDSFNENDNLIKDFEEKQRNLFSKKRNKKEL